METILVFAQIVFYFTVSVAIIVIGVLWSIIVYNLVRITRELKKVFHNINLVSSEVSEQIVDIINRLSDLPILSYFLRRRSRVKIKK